MDYIGLNSRELVDLQRMDSNMILVNMPILTHMKGLILFWNFCIKNRAGMIDNNELEKGLEVYRI